MFLICSCVRFFDSFIYYSQVNNVLDAIWIVCIYIHRIHHLIVSLVCVSYRITNLEGWSWSFSLSWVSPKQFNGFTRVMYNLYETASLITSSSDSGVRNIGFPVLVSSFLYMEAKERLNVWYLEIDPTILQNTENLLNTPWISNSRRQFSLWDIVFFYFPKYQVGFIQCIFI